jgi:hypothetical protein
MYVVLFGTSVPIEPNFPSHYLQIEELGSSVIILTGLRWDDLGLDPGMGNELVSSPKRRDWV